MDSEVVKTAVATAALPSPDASWSVVWKRLGSAVVFIPVFVWMVTRAPAWVFALLVIVAGAIASWELARLFERAGRPTYTWAGTAVGIGVTASFLVAGGPRVVLTVSVLLVLSGIVWRAAPPSADPAIVALLGVTYVSWLLGHALLLHGLPDGAAFVLFLVGVTWAGESAAYMVGSAMGRHKLAPVISPRKTVEGAAAQIIVSIAAAVALAAWLLPDWSLPKTAAAGLLLGVVGQIGDLAESAVKRSLGAKDTGAMIPGHGGVLDRLDSLLFNVPAFFYYVVYVGGAS